MFTPKFQFFGFDPDDDLQNCANLALDRLRDLSPYESVPVALLEKTPDGFRCAVDLYTKHGPLIAHSHQTTPREALAKTCEILHEKLAAWRLKRNQNWPQVAPSNLGPPEKRA